MSLIMRSIQTNQIKQSIYRKTFLYHSSGLNALFPVWQHIFKLSSPTTSMIISTDNKWFLYDIVSIIHLSAEFTKNWLQRVFFWVWGLNGGFRKYLSTFLSLIINVPLCPQHRSSHAQDSIVWYSLLAFSATLSSGTRECCLLNVYGPVLMIRIPIELEFFSYPIYHKTKPNAFVIGWWDNSRCSKEFKQWSIYLVSCNS